MEARETRDVMLFIAALVNTCDEIPLLGVLRGPLMGLPDEALYQMGREGRRRLFDKRFGPLRQLAGFVAPDRLIAQALDECSYWAGLNERARANVDKLLAWLRREFRNRPRPLAELLDDLEALRDSQSVADAPPPEAGDVVRVMTVHAAKGLEFPVVFVAGLHRRPDAHTPALLFSHELGLGAKWRNPATGEGAPDPVHARLKAREKAREEAEANRLLYVAMTRAEQRLILSHADRRGKTAWEKRAAEAIPIPVSSGEAPAIPVAEDGTPVRGETLLDPPTIGAQSDATTSATSVALFAACPRRYYLARYLGLEPEPDGAGTGAIATGLAVHAALAGEKVESHEARELADRFTASVWGQRALRAQRAEREFDFLFELDGVILSGQIDVWFEESGELVIVDYKTDRDATFADAYALQLRLYALALEPYAGRLPNRAVLFYVRLEETVEVDLSAAALDEARRSVAQLLAAQASGEFPLRPGEQCRKCAFFGGLCPEGRRKEESSAEGTKGLIFGRPSSLLAPPSDGL
jgi:ATP-dependent exoDNAse (exonuclease V) beta subunit